MWGLHRRKRSVRPGDLEMIPCGGVTWDLRPAVGFSHVDAQGDQREVSP